MAVFPNISPSYDYIVTPQFKTLKLGPTDGDFIQRRRKRTTPLYRFTLKYDRLLATEEKTLYDFYLSRYGAWEAFAFFDFDTIAYTGVSLGTGTGAATQFQMKARNTTGTTIYVDAIAKALGTDYTIGSGTGTDGQDKVTFTVAPGNGLAVTADYTGQKYSANCTFEADNMDMAMFQYNLYRTGLVIIEVTP